MIVHRSNRTEALVDALAELVATPLDDPFAAETIVVQGRGMERWLGLELARRLGVWANPAFPFPRAFMDQVGAAVLGAPPAGAAAYRPESLRWAIAAELPRQLGAPRFAPVQRFLDGDRDGSKLLPLCGRLADLFDQYAVFRPDLVLHWEGGGGDPDDWQPALWRTLVARGGAAHPAARARDLLAALAGGQAPRAPLPRRVSLFGLATLPPVYVEVLAALASLLEVHLFVLSPSALYWGDVPSARERRRARLAAAGRAAGDADLHLDAPPLLASLGRVGRDFQAVLEERAAYQEDDRYDDPGAATLLATLQSDLLHLRRRGADGLAPLVLDPADPSLAVHACHAPMREVEVLHDRLVALCAADPTLRPHDIIVMAPSIDRYAPLIEAVFTSPDRPRLPYYIADRRARATGEVIDVFLRSLELLGGRLPASAVLDLLALEPVRARFAIAAEALDALRTWVAAAGVTWGADRQHRLAEGLPDTGEHTWRFGLDRLLLGTALPSADDALWREVLPCADLEGSDAELLGQFVAFVDTLLEQRRLLAAPRPMAEWQAPLAALLAAVAQRGPATADQHDAILLALDGLAERAGAAGCDTPFGLDAVRRLLDAELAVDAAPPGFLTGAVTLCELVPMRSVPFRVVALVGLSDGEFPRQHRPLAFDHIARQPRPGDRTPRDDDRYLFLEALLAARQHLLLTYVGRSITDNTELPPSVVLSELLDAIDELAVAPPGADGAARPARALLVHQHPLQPFSPVAFAAPGPLASFARSQYAGAVALRGARQAPPPFLSAPLAAPPPPTTLELEVLLEFFARPARWFLRERLQLQLSEDEAVADDRDPVEVDALSRWQLGDRLRRRALRGAPAADGWRVLRAAGGLPLGTPGRLLVDALQPAAAAIADRHRALGGAPQPPREVVVSVEGVELSGVLADRCAAGLVVSQFSRVGGRHELQLWIRHLVLNAVVDAAASSWLIGRAARGDDCAAVRFRPVAEPRRHLATLLDLYRRGQARPLPLFAGASRAWAAALVAGRPAAAAARAAAGAFAASDYAIGDAGDPAVALLFPRLPAELAGGPPPADGEDARAVAQAVFAPLLEHREEA